MSFLREYSQNPHLKNHKSDPKAPFSIATTPRFREDRYSFPWIAPLCWALSKAVSSSIFWVVGMIRTGIEPRSPRPLANSLTIMPMSGSLTLWVECLPMVRETWVQSQVSSYQRLLKMVLYTSLLNAQVNKVRIKGKIEQFKERCSALPYISV